MASLMLVFTILGMLFVDVNSHEVLHSCKIKEKAAYDACLKKAAKDKSDRLMCSLMYLEKFPSCYFGKLKLCAEDLFKSFANCVVESQSHAEIRACVNVREGRRKVCQPTMSKREAASDGNRIQNPCKIKEKAAYDACLKKASKNKCDRWMCSEMYLDKFPSCYFHRNGKMKSCAEVLGESFVKCLLESQSDDEIGACDKVKEEKRKVCQPTMSKREAASDVDRIQMCSACKEERDRDCGVNTKSEGDWLQCLDAWKKLPRCQKCLE